MDDAEIAALKKLVAKWAGSPEGQEELLKTADKVRQALIEAEQQRRDDVVLLAKAKIEPMTI